MDLNPYLDPKPAPQALLDSLERFGPSAPRFMVASSDGTWRATSRGAFQGQVEQLALFLAGDGLGPGRKAAVIGQSSVDWAASGLAIQATGAALVPVYPSSTAAQCSYVLDHSDAEVAFVDAALFEKVRTSRPSKLRRLIVMNGSVAGEMAIADAASAETPNGPGRYRALLARLEAKATACIVYTSGTTGPPKGVVLSHANLAANGLDWLRCYAPAIEEGWTDLLWLPLSHLFGWGELCLGNLLGFTSYLSDPVRAVEHLPLVRPQVFMSVPSHWEKLYRSAEASAGIEGRAEVLRRITGGRLRFGLSGGAGLKREVKDAFQGAGLVIMEGYGLTEASPTLTLNRPDDYDLDTVGRPLPSVELKLAEDGEILARGPNVFAGYYKDPDATKAVLDADGFLRTGDVGRFTSTGFLQIIDRKKDILVTAGGKNVPPANIELRFFGDPVIAHAIVYGEGKSYLTALLVAEAGAVRAFARERGIPEAPLADLLRHPDVLSLLQRRVDGVNAELAPFERIRKFHALDRPLTVEDGFLTASFKVRRRAVYQAYGHLLEALYR